MPLASLSHARFGSANSLPRALLTLGLFVGALAAQTGSAGKAASAPVRPAAEKVIKLNFSYGSEKETWIKAVTETFHERKFKTKSGSVIRVNAVPMGSGEVIRTVLKREFAADIVSPASSVFIRLANGLMPDDQPVVGRTRSLVRSPVVIAMWKSMADALSKGGKPVGWADILDLVGSQQGWESLGLKRGGKFKFGHTHPEMSNSGIQSLIAIAYASAGKTEGLTVEDLARPEVAEFFRVIEGGVVHYGESTGFFGKKMFKYGPENLSAAVLYENMVIESYDPKNKLAEPLVAVYPKEGTFWSDHPVGIVNRDWVSDEHREACEIYIAYMMEEAQQKLAMKWGFRPGVESIPLNDSFSARFGVDPAQPTKLLEVPSRKVTQAILDVWRKNKKKANIVLAIDVSGSMLEDDKMEKAKAAARKIISTFGEDDRLSILTFGSDVKWRSKGRRIGDSRKELDEDIASLKPIGKTSLFDGVAEAHRYFQNTDMPGAIQAVIVLSDGEDTQSNLSPEQFFKEIKFHPDSLPTLIFTVAYGKDADVPVLKRIAELTQAELLIGDSGNIDAVLKKASAFFSSRSEEGF